MWKIFTYFEYIHKYCSRLMGEIEYYEGKELQELISRIDWNNVLPVLYASTRRMISKRFLSDPDNGLFGRNFKDFVHDAIEKLIIGKRKWPKNINIEQFFLATIRSIISQHIKKHYSYLSIDSTEEEILKHHYQKINMSFDIVLIRGIINNKLSMDEISLNIFDCWAEGIWKPSEVRELFNYSEQEYNNAKKRLDRILIDIRKQLIQK